MQHLCNWTELIAVEWLNAPSSPHSDLAQGLYRNQLSILTWNVGIQILLNNKLCETRHAIMGREQKVTIDNKKWLSRYRLSTLIYRVRGIKKRHSERQEIQSYFRIRIRGPVSNHYFPVKRGRNEEGKGVVRVAMRIATSPYARQLGGKKFVW